MTWITAISDLRFLLSDNSTDKFNFMKRIFGLQDGVNKTFKTFEIRRLDNFVTSTGTGIGVYINSSATGVDFDDVATGTFVLHNAPLQGDRIEATYHSQWFIDDQLSVFLKNASNFMGMGSNFSNVEDGLQPCALKFAASDAYQELSVRFARMLSEQYRVEDLPKEALHDVIKGYDDMAKNYRDSAKDLLKNFYTRQGRSDAPLFAFGRGRVRDVAPNR